MDGMSYLFVWRKLNIHFRMNPKLIGRPEGFTITVREIIPKLGAGFLVCLTGDIMTMPGLPKHPAALKYGCR